MTNSHKKSSFEVRLASALKDCVKVMGDYMPEYDVDSPSFVLAYRKAKSTLDQYKRGDHPSKGPYIKIGGK